MPTANPFSQAQHMVRIFKDDDALRARLKTDPDPMVVIQEAANTAEKAAIWTTDKTLYRVAVIVLGALAIIAAVGSIVLVGFGKNTPEVLVSLGSAAVGALVGLFAPTPTSK